LVSGNGFFQERSSSAKEWALFSFALPQGKMEVKSARSIEGNLLIDLLSGSGN